MDQFAGISKLTCSRTEWVTFVQTSILPISDTAYWYDGRQSRVQPDPLRACEKLKQLSPVSSSDLNAAEKEEDLHQDDAWILCIRSPHIERLAKILVVLLKQQAKWEINYRKTIIFALPEMYQTTLNRETTMKEMDEWVEVQGRSKLDSKTLTWGHSCGKKFLSLDTEESALIPKAINYVLDSGYSLELNDGSQVLFFPGEQFTETEKQKRQFRGYLDCYHHSKKQTRVHYPVEFEDPEYWILPDAAAYMTALAECRSKQSVLNDIADQWR